jgi:hypothetical protein
LWARAGGRLRVRVRVVRIKVKVKVIKVGLRTLKSLVWL